MAGYLWPTLGPLLPPPGPPLPNPLPSHRPLALRGHNFLKHALVMSVNSERQNPHRSFVGLQMAASELAATGCNYQQHPQLLTHTPQTPPPPPPRPVSARVSGLSSGSHDNCARLWCTYSDTGIRYRVGAGTEYSSRTCKLCSDTMTLLRICKTVMNFIYICK